MLIFSCSLACLLEKVNDFFHVGKMFSNLFSVVMLIIASSDFDGKAELHSKFMCKVVNRHCKVENKMYLKNF